jgi:hypothetical protein
MEAMMQNSAITNQVYSRRAIELTFGKYSQQRLANLLNRLSHRANEWAWYEVYLRWRQGEPTTRFERKWLALTTNLFARHLPGDEIDHVKVRETRPWSNRQEVA